MINTRLLMKIMVEKPMDLLRDLCIEWGEPIVVKTPKGVSSDLNVTGQWVVVVRRIMNGTGVLKVYLIQTKKYAYRLKFVRAITPEWVLEALKNVSTDDLIGFEDEENAMENQVQEMIAEVESQERKSVMYENDIDTLGDEEEIQIIGGQKKRNSGNAIHQIYRGCMERKERKSGT